MNMKIAVYRSRREEPILPSEPSEETKPILISDFGPPEPRDHTFLLFKPHSLWYFVTADLAKWHTLLLYSYKGG